MTVVFCFPCIFCWFVWGKDTKKPHARNICWHVSKHVMILLKDTEDGAGQRGRSIVEAEMEDFFSSCQKWVTQVPFSLFWSWLWRYFKPEGIFWLLPKQAIFFYVLLFPNIFPVKRTPFVMCSGTFPFFPFFPGSQPKEEDREFSFSWRGAKKFSSFRHWRNRESRHH